MLNSSGGKDSDYPKSEFFNEVKLSLVLVSKFIGIEKEKRTFDIATARINEIEERSGLVYRKGRVNPYTGSVIEKFHSGQKHYEKHYKDGMPNGKWLYWDEYGKKTWEHIYDNGKLLGKWSFKSIFII